MKELAIGGLLGIGVGYGIAYLIAAQKGAQNAVNPFAQRSLNTGGQMPPPPPPGSGSPYPSGPTTVNPVTANTVQGTQFGVRSGMI